MYDSVQIARLFDQRQPGYTLPQAFYLDQAIYEFDLDAIFNRSWIMVGFEAELAQSGAYLALTIGRTPVLVVRNPRGEIVGFHNSCRHRGAQIVPDGTGRAPRLVCPYHQWSYDLSGRLLAARGAPPGFCLETHPLLPVRVESVAGCIYATLSDEAPDFAPFRAVLERNLATYNLSNLKVAYASTLVEQGNWKLAMENARECHHCSAGHPEFVTAVPVEEISSTLTPGVGVGRFTDRMAALGLDTMNYVEDWWQVGRIPMTPGYVSFSTDGKPLVAKPLTDLGQGDLGTLRWAIEPHNFCHVTSDCVFSFSANPTGPRTTEVTTKWLVHKDAREGIDYDVGRLIHLWNLTNLQDQKLVENNQRGVAGAGYRPGPYSPTDEPFVMYFVDWYCRQARQFLGGPGRTLTSSAA